VKRGLQHYWWNKAGTEYEVNEAWVERRVKEETEKFDREHDIEESQLDPPVPDLTD
jgi:hypothetical protein